MIFKGWVFRSPNYDLGKIHIDSDQLIRTNAPGDMFETHFYGHEKRIKEEYKNKINDLKVYFDDINNQFSLKNLSPAEIHDKVYSYQIYF